MRSALLVLVAVSACRSQDAADQAELRRHCLLPRDAPVLAWQGSKAAGFGQREGLYVYGVFGLAPAELTAYERRLAGARWAPLPIPEEERSVIELFVRNDALAKAAGLYWCGTAGDDVLRGTATKPCANGMNDIVTCVYDRPSHEVFAAVRASY